MTSVTLRTSWTQWRRTWNAKIYGAQQLGEFTIGFLASAILAAALGPSPLGVHLSALDRLGIFAVSLALFRIAFSFATLRQNLTVSSILRRAAGGQLWSCIVATVAVLALLLIGAAMFFGVGNPTEFWLVLDIRSLIATLIGKPDRVELTKLSVSTVIVLAQIFIYLPLWAQERLLRNRLAVFLEKDSAISESEALQAKTVLVYLDRWLQIDRMAFKLLGAFICLFFVALLAAVDSGGDAARPFGFLELAILLAAVVSIFLTLYDLWTNSSLYSGEFGEGELTKDFRA